nr:MAG TPA: hypothetical protein [Caudoviricetes sp.]
MTDKIIKLFSYISIYEKICSHVDKIKRYFYVKLTP